MAISATRGFWYGVLAALFWSPHLYIVADLLRDPDRHTPPLVLYFHIIFWAALACLLLLFLAGRWGELSAALRRGRGLFVLALSGGYGLWLLQALALERAFHQQSSAQALVHPTILMILGAGPLFLGLFSLPGREPASGRQLTALLVGLAGVGVITRFIWSPALSGSWPSRTGILIAAAGAVCWAWFAMEARIAARQEKALPLLAIVLMTGAACLLVTCGSTHHSVFDITRRDLGASVLLGTVTVVLGFACWLKCLAASTPAAAATLWYLASLFGVFWAVRIAGLPLSWWILAGVALIIFAVATGAGGRRRGDLSVSDVIRAG